MVKNRYKSLVTKFRKLFKPRRLQGERNLLSAMQDHLQEPQCLQGPASEPGAEVGAELSADLHLPQSLPNNIESYAEITEVPLDDEAPRFAPESIPVCLPNSWEEFRQIDFR